MSSSTAREKMFHGFPPPRRLGQSYALSQPTTKALKRATVKQSDVERDLECLDEPDYHPPAAKKFKKDSKEDQQVQLDAVVATYDGAPLKSFTLFLPPKLPASILESISALQEFVHLTATNYIRLWKLDVNMDLIEARLPAFYEDKLSGKGNFLKKFMSSLFKELTCVKSIAKFYAPKVVLHPKTNLSDIFQILKEEDGKVSHLFLPLSELKAQISKYNYKSFASFLHKTNLKKLTIVSTDSGLRDFCQKLTEELKHINGCIIKVMYSDKDLGEAGPSFITNLVEGEGAGEPVRPLVLARSINTRTTTLVHDQVRMTLSKPRNKKRGKTACSTDCTYYDEADLNSQGSFTSEMWNLDELHSEGIDGSGMTIAVIDSGINYTHPAFKDRILAVKNFVKDEADNIDCAIDSDGHGTLCAGIAAGSSFYCPTSPSPESECIKIPPGVAPGSQLVICKVVRTSDGTVDSDALLEALCWLKEVYQSGKLKVDVISISLASTYYHQPRAQVISELSALGVIIVCCASNVGRLRLQPISFPARLGHVLCIGAHDMNGKPTSFSPVGRELDFLSPGDDIWGPGPGTEGPFAMNCASGTSCATPGMAGLVCLVLNAIARMCQRNPKKFSVGGKSLLELVHNVWVMRELLKEISSSPGHHSDEIGHGTLDPYRLLDRSDGEIMRVINEIIEDE